MSDRKRLYLVCYDYGMGGLWGAILARSDAEIKAVYPELDVASERPAWMTDERFQHICDTELHDIDGAPWGILNGVLTDREARRRDKP